MMQNMGGVAQRSDFGVGVKRQISKADAAMMSDDLEMQMEYRLTMTDDPNAPGVHLPLAHTNRKQVNHPTKPAASQP